MYTENLKKENLQTPQFDYPKTPFESIGFALSGGGFRAAAYGLGVLSFMDFVKWQENGTEVNLLQKVSFVSSASGGTIPLAVYVATLHHGIAFSDFYHHLNKQMTGELIVEKAISILKDKDQWKKELKSRNIINAFAKAYDDTLFSIIPEAGRTLGGIMGGSPNKEISVQNPEFCFNSTDFYTGITFRFQGANEWRGNQGGMLGNANIGIDFSKKDESITALKEVRLSDVLAASSCFPMGFEPIIFPEDFTYPGGPTVAALGASLKLNTLTWDNSVSDLENQKSPRAFKEKEFTSAKRFALMDGGICDNQGLYSMLLANERDRTKESEAHFNNRFDLMMVSDVTSYFMSPYKVSEIKTDKAWMQMSPMDYWKFFRNIYKRIGKWINIILWASFVIAIAFVLPLVMEGASIAAIALAGVGLLLVVAGIIIREKYKAFLKSEGVIQQSLAQSNLEALVQLHVPNDSFAKRTAVKLVNYLQDVDSAVILQMINTRLQSSAIMIGDVFLKQMRRLIYDQLFSNPIFFYRRLNNVIYKLTYTNNKGRNMPAFEPREKEVPNSYNQRKAAFIEDVNVSCRLSEPMQKTAETAYGTGTTMWFESEQELSPTENNREALIATGQFTTCYNILAYALRLNHSRHFKSLDEKYQARITAIIVKLRLLMLEFEKDPYYMYNLLDKKSR